MAQLAADQDLIRRAQLERFAGPAWAKLARGLVEYGYPVMGAWIWTGRVFRHCREKRISVGKAPDGGFAPGTAEELAVDTVGIGLTMFEKEVLRTGLWDPTRGASLTSFFMGQCLLRFPTIYRDWVRAVGKERALAAALGAVRTEAEPQDPAVLFDRGATEAELLDQFSDPLTRDIVRLKLQGWSQAEICEALDVTEGTVEGRLYRLRQRRLE